MFNSYPTLLFLAIALVLAFAVPLKAQDQPQDYLNAHNRVRGLVGVGPLVWSETLATYARSYVRLRRNCHSAFSGGPYGEAIAWATIDLSAEQDVTVWENQRSNYSYATNTCRVGKICVGYTQVVWRKLVSFGCAKVRCDM